MIFHLPPSYLLERNNLDRDLECNTRYFESVHLVRIVKCNLGRVRYEEDTAYIALCWFVDLPHAQARRIREACALDLPAEAALVEPQTEH